MEKIVLINRNGTIAKNTSGGTQNAIKNVGFFLLPDIACTKSLLSHHNNPKMRWEKQ